MAEELTFEETLLLVNYRMKEICDRIRVSSGKTEKIPLIDIPYQLEYIYDDGVTLGKSIQRSEFWDKYQDYGNRTDYAGAFCGIGWDDTTCQPPYPMQPTSAYYMFYKTNITTAPRVDFSKSTDITRIYASCENLEYVPEIDISSAKITHQCFRSSPKLKTVERLRMSETTSATTGTMSFYDDFVLERCIFEGVCACTFDLHWSKNLDHESLMSLLNILKDYSEEGGTTKKITLGTTLLAKLTDEEKAIATQKGWTLA